MNTSRVSARVSDWLLRAATFLALPTIACSGYYSLNRLGDDAGRWATLVILAYPVILISLLVLVSALLAPQISKLKLWASGACLILASTFLFMVWH
jgi:hypothetical protein